MLKFPLNNTPINIVHTQTGQTSVQRYSYQFCSQISLSTSSIVTVHSGYWILNTEYVEFLGTWYTKRTYSIQLLLLLFCHCRSIYFVHRHHLTGHQAIVWHWAAALDLVVCAIQNENDSSTKLTEFACLHIINKVFFLCALYEQFPLSSRSDFIALCMICGEDVGKGSVHIALLHIPHEQVLSKGIASMDGYPLCRIVQCTHIVCQH